MDRLVAAVALLGRFLLAIGASGLRTALVIARGGRGAAAGFVRIRFAPLSPTGAVLLGSMISLTPGTTVIEVDLDAREMLLHLLDASQPERILDGIRNDLERHLLVLFAEEAR